MRISIYTTLLVCVLGCLHAFGQGDDVAQRRGLEVLALNYLSFYEALAYKRGPSEAPFLALFGPGSINLENDYCKGTLRFSSADDYYQDIVAFFIDNQPVKVRGIRCIRPSSILYAREGDHYCIWVSKTIYYSRKGQDMHYGSQQRLTVRWLGSDQGYRIVAVANEVSFPNDADGDSVPDSWDDCPGTETGSTVSITGCKIDPGATASRDNSGSARGGRSGGGRPAFQTGWSAFQPGDGRSGFQTGGTGSSPQPFHTYNPPSCRFGVSLDGGGLYNLPGSGMNAQRPGYTGGLSFNWYISGWLAAAVGYRYLFLPFDPGPLKTRVEAYLQQNHIVSQPVSVTSTGYQLHLVYGSLGVGTYRHENTIVGIAPLAGFVYSFDNTVRLNVGEGSQASLASSPFVVYGGRMTIQQSLGWDSPLRLELSAFYLQGRSSGAPVSVPIAGTAGTVPVPAPDLRMAGVTLGLQLTLHTP